MEDMMNKLQSILNDEESMKHIQELAGMLAAGTDETQQSAAQSPPVTSNSSQSSPQNQTQQQNSNEFDISQLLQGLGINNGGQPKNQNQTSDFDFSKLLKIQQVVQAANKPDNNISFLLALKPLLRDENKVKIDRLVKIFKLFSIYPLIKESGLGGDLLGLF